MRAAYVLLVAASLLAAACTASPSPQAEREARDTLERFFVLLNEGRYAEAVLMYGGPYDSMRDNNPSVPPADLATLMHNACEINGVKCLRPKTITLERTISEAEFLFLVEFQDEDGSLFVRGPCCGASPTDQPPEAVFSYTVAKSDEGNFLVMDMPPYVP